MSTKQQLLKCVVCKKYKDISSLDKRKVCQACIKNAEVKMFVDLIKR